LEGDLRDLVGLDPDVDRVLREEAHDAQLPEEVAERHHHVVLARGARDDGVLVDTEHLLFASVDRDAQTYMPPPTSATAGAASAMACVVRAN
jgi:hypothetical protein